MPRANDSFLSGVIEGFYGPPWTRDERLELFRWMAAAQLNTYFHAPKDDPHHRVRWRVPYPDHEAAALRDLIERCHQHDLDFFYALGPGLDIRYHDSSDLDALRSRCDQLMTLGCRNFGLLFDDIPDRLNAADVARWGSLAAAQCHVTNTLFQDLRARRSDARLLFCPTPYCGRMATAGVGGLGYLETLGRELATGIDIFWTGPEIISREIPPNSIEDLHRLLKRKPVIWDNLFANDYDGRRYFCGPYSGRSVEVRSAVRGILLNPNTEFRLNFVPVRTFGAYLKAETWDPRRAYIESMGEWFNQWSTWGAPLDREDFLLLGDCYYLPYEDGPTAIALQSLAESVLGTRPETWGQDAVRLRSIAGRLGNFCARLAELQQRPLFHALSRRIWDVKEELDLLVRYLDFKSSPENGSKPFASDFHLPQTFRGGWLAKMQRSLTQQPDGTFRAAGEVATTTQPSQSARAAGSES